MSARRWFQGGAAVGLGLLLAGVLPGCLPKRLGGATPADQVIDNLRRQNAEQQAAIDALKGDLDRSQAQGQLLKQQLAATRPAIAGIDPAQVPHLAAIQFDGFTAAEDTDGDGVDDTIRLYVLTVDQQGRFIPVAGKAVAQAVVIEPNQPAKTLVEKNYSPDDFNSAYRSGLTGTHYSLDLPLPRPLPAGLKQVTLKLTLTDGATGLTVSTERPIGLVGAK